MSKILVTGATGTVGKKTVEHLLKTVPAKNIVALSRNAEKAENLPTGVEVRIADYFDYDSLLRAFEGVDKVMLTSSHAFTDRCTQHYNVITAARQAGVKHVVYMSIMRKEKSALSMPDITESDTFTEQTLKSSGLNYTIVYHPPFTEVLPFYYGSEPYKNGIKLPEGLGKMAPATRDELAEAHAVILSQSGHENKSYSLSGSEAISFSDIARILSEIKGEPVPYETISTKEYADMRLAEGLPEHLVQFVTDWVLAINGGEYNYQSGDLERLLGRKTMIFRDYIERSTN